jgi:hypothetical protein
MHDIGFARLSPPAKILEYYLRTCPQRATEGLFRFGFGAASDDLGMGRQEIEAAAVELERAGRPFVFDRANGIVLDTSALKLFPLRARSEKWSEGEEPKTVNKRLKGAISKLRSLPETPLLNHLYSVARDHSPDFADWIFAEFQNVRDPLQAPSEAPSNAASPAPSKPRGETSRYEESRGERVRPARTLAEEELAGEVVQMRRPS